MKIAILAAVAIALLLAGTAHAGETHYIIESSKEGAISFAASESVSVRVERYGETDFRCRQVEFEEFQEYQDDECWEWVGTGEVEDVDALERAWEAGRGSYHLEHLSRHPPTKAVFYFRLLCTRGGGGTP